MDVNDVTREIIGAAIEVQCALERCFTILALHFQKLAHAECMSSLVVKENGTHLFLRRAEKKKDSGGRWWKVLECV